MSNAESKIEDVMTSINERRRKALPAADVTIACNHCSAECVNEGDGYHCKPCGLSFDLDGEETWRTEDHEPECGAEPALARAGFWAASDMKLWPCNLTQGHETTDHHHPVTHEEVTA